MRLIPLLFLGCLATICLPSATAQSVTVAGLQTVGSQMGVSEGPFTLYSLRESRIVPQEDSASADWDIGFRSTTIIVNGGTSGPGENAIALLSIPFEEVTGPPDEDLFLADGDRECSNGSFYAVCTGSLNGWYEYAGSGVVEPLPSVTLVIRLAESRYAKVRILKYELAENGRQYTFEYQLL